MGLEQRAQRQAPDDSPQGAGAVSQTPKEILMTARSTANKLHLTLDRDEALGLMAVLGNLRGKAARVAPSYDEIADALEAPNGILRHTTISKAMQDAGLYSLDIS